VWPRRSSSYCGETREVLGVCTHDNGTLFCTIYLSVTEIIDGGMLKVCMYVDSVSTFTLDHFPP
jgi:hypothetical protein